jgi:hypothetical protein
MSISRLCRKRVREPDTDERAIRRRDRHPRAGFLGRHRIYDGLSLQYLQAERCLMVCERY